MLCLLLEKCTHPLFPRAGCSILAADCPADERIQGIRLVSCLCQTFRSRWAQWAGWVGRVSRQQLHATLAQLGAHSSGSWVWAVMSAGFFWSWPAPADHPCPCLGQPKAQLIAVSTVPCALQQLVPRTVVRKGQAEAVVKLLSRLIREYKDVNAIFANSCVCLACLAIQEGPSFEELSRQVGTC